jgi:KaiC/GvpD/RAD55 family RecA-like ATPase
LVKNGKNIVNTYIENLNNIIDGGIPSGHINLIIGPTGALKSTIGYYILFNNIKDNKNSLYLSIKEDKDNLNLQMKNFNIDINENEDAILFLDIASMRINTELSNEAWFQLIKTSISDLKRANKCKLLVIDSWELLLTITNLTNNEIEIFDFIRWLKKLKLTTFLISDRSDQDLIRSNIYEFNIVDGIILLDLNDKVTPPYRRIKIIKMRGVNHSNEFYKLEVSPEGFKVLEI